MKLIELAVISQYIYSPQTQLLPYPYVEDLVLDRVALLREDFTNDCVVVHKGTSDIYDIMHDIESQLDECTSFGVLDAFENEYTHYESQHAAIIAEILDNPCNTIYQTGHSLGGVIAELAVENYPIETDAVITFGAPRICCGETNMTSSSRLTRVVGSQDIIPNLPISIDVGDIRHCHTDELIPVLHARHSIQSYIDNIKRNEHHWDIDVFSRLA